jgi:hypothetical protein
VDRILRISDVVREAGVNAQAAQPLDIRTPIGEAAIDRDSILPQTIDARPHVGDETIKYLTGRRRR